MAQARSLAEGRHTEIVGMLLALALVLAQSGAIVHGWSHLRASGAVASTPATAGQACKDCLSFAPMLATAGGKWHAPAVAPGPVTTTYRTLTPPLVGFSPRHAFLSRAPPPFA